MLLYILEKAQWIFMILLSAFTMTVLMILNHIPSREIIYGMGLGLFLVLCIITADFVKVYRKCRILDCMAQHAVFSLQGLERTDDPLEASWLCLVENLVKSRVEQQNEMERRSIELKEYFTMWVHQIKTPIFAMRLLLREKNGAVDLSGEMDELFDIERYVEMALQYMRLDSESTDFVLRRIQLDDVLKETIHKYARLFVRGKIKLDYTNVNTFVHTDEKWLAFVLEQIFSNAVKYTPAGTVSVFMADTRTLVIADTGIGICAQDLPRVFEKGYTGYNGHEDKRSSGIGLYLCSRIMKKLGHGFEIESKQGEGTRVMVRFPESK